MCEKQVYLKPITSALSQGFARPSTVVRALVAAICGNIEDRSDSGRITYNDMTSKGFRVKMFTTRQLVGAEKYKLYKSLVGVFGLKGIKIKDARNERDLIVSVKLF